MCGGTGQSGTIQSRPAALRRVTSEPSFFIASHARAAMLREDWRNSQEAVIPIARAGESQDELGPIAMHATLGERTQCLRGDHRQDRRSAGVQARPYARGSDACAPFPIDRKAKCKHRNVLVLRNASPPAYLLRRSPSR